MIYKPFSKFQVLNVIVTRLFSYIIFSYFRGSKQISFNWKRYNFDGFPFPFIYFWNNSFFLLDSFPLRNYSKHFYKIVKLDYVHLRILRILSLREIIIIREYDRLLKFVSKKHTETLKKNSDWNSLIYSRLFLVKLVVGFAMPVQVSGQILSYGQNIQFQYMLPNNATFFTNYFQDASRRRRRASWSERVPVYDILQRELDM